MRKILDSVANFLRKRIRLQQIRKMQMAEGGMRLFTQPVVKQVRHTSQIVLFNTLSSLKKNVDCPSLSGKRISVSLKLEFDEKCLMFKLFFVSMNRGGIYSETSRSLDECGEPLCRNLF